MEGQLFFLDFFKQEKNIWFIDFLSGALFVSDLQTESTRLIADLPVNSEKENYRVLHIVDEKIYMPPLFAKNLLIYDLAEKQIRQISLEKYVVDDKPNFIDILEYQHYLFCIPMNAKGIVRINTINDEVDVYDDFMECLRPLREPYRPRFMGASTHKGKIYLSTCNENAVIVFDMASCTFEKNEIRDCDRDGYRMCCYTDSGIVLITYDDRKALLLDDQMRLIKALNLDGKSRYSMNMISGNIVMHIGCAEAGASKIIDRENERITELSLEPGPEKTMLYKAYPDNSFMFSCKMIDGRIWLYSTHRGTLCVFSLKGEKLGEYRFNIANTDEKILLKNRGLRLKREMALDKQYLIYEDVVNTLNVFVNAVEEQEGDK